MLGTRSLAAAALTLAALVGAACVEKSKLPPAPPCYAGDVCDPNTHVVVPPGGNGGTGGTGGTGGGGSGGTGGGASGGTGGTGGSGDVQGTIIRLEEETFSVATSFFGTGVNVAYPDAALAPQTTTVVNGAFTLTNAASGLQWLKADVTDFSIQAWSTYSFHDLNAAGLEVPIIGTAVLEGIGQTLAPPLVVDASRMHVVVKTGASGIQLATNFTGATIAYDVGAGQYSTNATQTGAGGVILVLNSFVPGATFDLSLLDQNGNPAGTVSGVPCAAGAVSYVIP